MFKIFTFCLLLFLFSHLNTFSQNYTYEHFDVDNGLPSSEIYDIYQSREGYIWFATDRGLANYNGYEFKKFGKKEELPGDVILDFFPQSNGQIWCATLHTGKLFFFNNKFDGFETYKYNNLLAKILPKGTIIESVYLEPNNTLHIGGSKINGEIIISNEGDIIKRGELLNRSEKSYIITRTNEDGSIFYFITNKNIQLKHNEIKTELGGIDVPRKVIGINNNMLSAAINGKSVELFNIEQNTTTTIRNSFSPIGVNKANNSHFLIGYNYGGAKLIDFNGNIKLSFLEDKSVTSFLIDHDGGYWFTTLYSGVFYIKNPNIKIKEIKETESAVIKSLVKTNKKELYVAYHNADIINLKNNRKPLFYRKNNLNIRGAAFVEYDSINNKLYSYFGKNLITNHLDGDKKNRIGYSLKLSEAKEGIIFASQINKIIRITNEEAEVISLKERCLDACLLKNDLYVATPKGLYKQTKDSIISLAKTSKLLSYRIEDIDVNSNNDELYIATIGAGVVIYKGDNVCNIDMNNGLYSNTVNEIHFENDKTLWVCTDLGINKIEFSSDKTYEITGVNSNDGLLSNEIEDVEIINDTLWVGTKKGLCYFSKGILSKQKFSKSFLKLKKIKVNDSLVDIEPSLQFDYNENRIEFFVEGVSFNNRKELSYKYKLEGLDNKWHYSNNRNITFSALPYGKYTFITTVCLGINEFCSDEIIKQSFTILPPFWKRWWFYLLCFIGVSTLIYLFFKYRILSYNKDITRELLRLVIKKIKKKDKFLTFREAGKDIRIKTDEVLYVRSSGNYIDIITETENYTVRCKISEFISTTPDPLEYIRIHRSFIIRIDKVKSKSKNEVIINNETLSVSAKYLSELDKIHF